MTLHKIKLRYLLLGWMGLTWLCLSLFALASCTQPSSKHPMYPIDTTTHEQVKGISYGKNWGL